MNLFQKYGIKEVADVTFYSIIEIGDEELYIPVLYLDTLKISDVNQTSDKVNHKGGYGNQQMIAWQHSKKFTLSLEDALFTPTSMNMTMGWVNNKTTKYINLIKKLEIVNKYYKNNYSIYAFPSPQLTEDEQELLFTVLSERFYDAPELPEDFYVYIDKNKINEPYFGENRHIVLEIYYKRNNNIIPLIAYNKKTKEIQRIYDSAKDGIIFQNSIITAIFRKINEVKDFNTIKTDYYNIQVLDRMEKCYVTKDEGLAIDVKQQINNLYRYYSNDRTSNYFILYDEKTMQPLALFDKKWFVGIDDDNQMIINDNTQLVDEYGNNIEDKFTLKKGTVYYKWSRTIQPVLNDNSFIGKSLVIDGNTFPGKYKIVGETYIREQNTSKDQRYQFVIPYAAISSDQKIELRADGGPSVFSMNVDVLSKNEEPQIELRQFNVDKDLVNGGTYIIPQNVQYTYTPIIVKDNTVDEIENEEIY